MKATYSTLMFLVFIVIKNEAQIPDNFQFLDHTAHKTKAGLVKVTDQDILFTDFTRVLQATASYALNRKAGFNYYSLSQRLFEVNDSTFHIILCDLVEIDFPVKGYFIYSRIGSEESIISRVTTPSAFNGYYRSVLPDHEGGVYVLDEKNDLLHITADGLTDTLGKFSNIEKLFLYSNCNDKVYVFNEKDNNLYRRDGDYNYICHEGFTLRKYDCDFNNILHEWNLSDSVTSFQQIQFLPDNQLYIDIIKDQHSYQILHIDSNSNVDLIFDGKLGLNEHVIGAHVINDSTHLLHGIHLFEHTENQFFRTVHTNLTPEYPLSNIEIKNYKITIDQHDLVEFHLTVLNPTLDSIKSLGTFYDITDDKSYKGLSFFLQEALPPNSTTTLNTGGVYPFDPESFLSDLENRKIEIPGANYKFLKSGALYTLPEIATTAISSTILDEVSVYPNPVTDNIYINLSGKLDYELNIYSLQGQLLLSARNEAVVNLNTLPTGTYFLQVKDNDSASYIAEKITKN